MIEAERAGIDCPECAVVTWLSGTDGPIDADAPTPPPASKPLPARARVEIDVDALKLDAPDGEAQEALAAAFAEALQAGWERTETHDALVQRAGLTDQLAFLGLRYRAVLDVAPDDEGARRARERILAQAMAKMTPIRADEAPGQGQGVKIALLTLATVAGLGAVVWLLRSLDALQAAAP